MTIKGANMRKGFSLVELSTVLLVIGILILISVKARILVEGAIARSNVYKVQQLESAFRGMMAISQSNVHEKVLNRSSAGIYDRQQFLDADLASEKDFLVAGTTNKYWDYITCDRNDNDTNRHLLKTDFTGQQVCLISDANYNSGGVPERFACDLDVMLDDSMSRYGMIRSNLSDNALEKCVLLANSNNLVNLHFHIF